MLASCTAFLRFITKVTYIYVHVSLPTYSTFTTRTSNRTIHISLLTSCFHGPGKKNCKLIWFNISWHTYEHVLIKVLKRLSRIDYLWYKYCRALSYFSLGKYWISKPAPFCKDICCVVCIHWHWFVRLYREAAGGVYIHYLEFAKQRWLSTL